MPERFIPAWKILEGGLDPLALDGMIVFIGTSAAGLKDLRATPLNPVTVGVEIHAQIDAAAAAVETTLPQIGEDVLGEAFPEEILGQTVSTRDFLVHLTSHLAYHLGQVDYHRRLITGIDVPLPRMSIDPLRSKRP